MYYDILGGVIYALNAVFNVAKLLIIARALLSWLPFDFGNRSFYKLTAILYHLTEPVIEPIRNVLAKTKLGEMPLDFSPLVAFFAIELMQGILFSVIAAFT